MAREDGYVRLACDRAEAVHPGGAMPVEYMRPEDKRYAEWTDVSYTDTHGVAMRMTLCPDCAAKHRSIMETHDRDMTDFANEGRR
ncbi:hypothetical protein [Adlercreutzia muris]|jgi:hypothetical protein|uniref:hypothetical protein n=1 Tax=Adlercreutzia muris TaxID=1796610 RepID=UPI00216FA2E3|nr:hypothetical protein [Enterorhabdus sp.]